MALPLIQSSNSDLMQVETKWKSQLDPVLGNPILGGRLIQNVNLTSGDNVINHGLGQKLQGYFIVLLNTSSSFFDKQNSNSMPQLTLVLNSSNGCTVSLWVF